MSSPVISIIVPVYNAEKYINKCLDSILTQTLTDWECILVDDGSADNSGNICDEYAAKDSRFKVIHKENGGVCSARNLGISETKGEWILFVDADDKLNRKILLEVEQVIDDTDFIAFNWEKVSPQGVILQAGHLENMDLTFSQYWETVYADAHLLAPWSFAYKKSIIDQFSISFKEGIIMSEDRLFNVEYLLHVNKVRTIKYVGYRYLDNMGSVCNSKNSPQKAKSHVKAALLISELYQQSNENSFILGDVVVDCLNNFIPTILDTNGYYKDFDNDVNKVKMTLIQKNIRISNRYISIFLAFPKLFYHLIKLKKILF